MLELILDWLFGGVEGVDPFLAIIEMILSLLG